MLKNISTEKTILLRQKQEEIKRKLDQEFIIYNSGHISIRLSLLGNIIEISNPGSKGLIDIITIINEATTEARQLFDVKQAEMLQKELVNLI
ncbi:hypothetical protein D1631_04000 [Chryseobacterium nematophagum]|uniref:YbaB/EbfC family DNA-binding protein n=1 Tax=Chryseobacterium nematophagum TaxID=2305228 RepID=A0A3M7TDT2_9FLAO|nr:hypothetical protein [Chryseobacterium nematophagum]RNA61156.1 hypothetical protein D1631_04000 [Chryseobacterium nematophagum]